MNQRHEALFEQLRSYRNELLEIVNGLTDEEADAIPAGFNNNVRWNLGHVCLDQYLWIRVLVKEDIPLPTKYNDWFGFGTSPSDFEPETPRLRELIALLNEQPEIIRKRYQDRLEVQYPPTEMGMSTIEQVLIRTIFHEGLHIGAIIAILKQLRNGGAESQEMGA